MSAFLSLFSRCLRVGLLLGLGLLALGAAAQSAPQPVPALMAHAMDLAGVLDATQRKALDDKLVAFEAATGSQLAVLLVSTTAPEDIASYANRVGNAWKIGRKDIGDGLLLVVAKDDHKLRIEVAKSLEGAIPDLAAKRVIAQDIAPRFKQGDYAGGLDAGVDALMALVRHEALPAPAEDAQAPSVWWHFALGVVIVDFLCIVFLALFGSPESGGASLIASLVGAVPATWVWLAFHDGLTAFWTAMVCSSLCFFALRVAGSTGNFAPAPSVSTPKGNTSSSSSSWFSSSDSGSSDSSSSSDSFSSGGGGDFGGGGASGDW